MKTLEMNGTTVEMNDEGFLLDAAKWTPEIGEALARESGLALGDQHWKVITFCREDAAREGGAPGLRRIAKMSGPKGPGKLAARIAGLPKPQACI